MKNSNKGIKIKTISIIFAIVGFVVILIMGCRIHRIVINYKTLVDEFQTHTQSHKYITDLYDASDTLTDQTHLFVVTKDFSHITEYFKIIDCNIRENAKNNLEECFSNIDNRLIKAELEKALTESNNLMDYEIHAMKLTVETLNFDENIIPEKIKSYQLPENEISLSNDEKQELALDYVFGDNYLIHKDQVRNDIEASVGVLSSQLEEETSIGIKTMWKTINTMVFLCALMVVLFLLFVLFIFQLIIKPLQIYVHCINKNKLIDIVGSYEFKYLALTYNNIFEINQENRERLNFEVEHDALTNVYSRLAFNKETQILSQTKLPIALLIIDVDKFKTINDSYGHEVGDQALKKVAKLLQQNFSQENFVARIGGDEFAVILTNVYKNNIDLIGNKLTRINDILQNPESDNIKLSLSIGIAFSEDGYKEKMFNEADQALYQTKENGRCGYSIFENVENIKI